MMSKVRVLRVGLVVDRTVVSVLCEQQGERKKYNVLIASLIIGNQSIQWSSDSAAEWMVKKSVRLLNEKKKHNVCLLNERDRCVLKTWCVNYDLIEWHGQSFVNCTLYGHSTENARNLKLHFRHPKFPVWWGLLWFFFFFCHCLWYDNTQSAFNSIWYEICKQKMVQNL